MIPQIEKPETVQEAPEQKTRKDNKKEKKEKESAALSPDELKELDDLKQKIIEDGGGMQCGMPFACLWNIE